MEGATLADNRNPWVELHMAKFAAELFEAKEVQVSFEALADTSCRDLSMSSWLCDDEAVASKTSFQMTDQLDASRHSRTCSGSNVADNCKRRQAQIQEDTRPSYCGSFTFSLPLQGLMGLCSDRETV